MLNPGNYFLRISGSCLDQNFTISCDKDFITTLLYKKSGEQTFYVSSQTHVAQAFDITEEVINSFCLGLTDCDYEGTLWATLALAKIGEDITPYLPYISAESDENENKRYLPSAFLYRPGIDLSRYARAYFSK